ncbi:NAD(P)H-binding protein [Paenibacillus sp. P26]|nr:NAD(P)H-binding protein [Paenibacillus sp. P26]
MIVVTGANGNLGRKIVEELLERVPSEEIGVSVRDTNKAQDLQERGVRVRQGNFEDSESLLHAFEQASQVLIVSSNALEGEEAVRQHQTAIDMAKKAGVGRVLYTSHMGSSATSYFPHAHQCGYRRDSEIFGDGFHIASMRLFCQFSVIDDQRCLENRGIHRPGKRSDCLDYSLGPGCGYSGYPDRGEARRDYPSSYGLRGD